MRRPMRPVHPRNKVLGWVALVPLLFPSAGTARIIGDVISAGFNARGPGGGGRWVVRVGVWTPIVVQLTLEGQAQFNGRLRVAQRDRDGDVCYDYHDVLLNADSTATREYTLYTLPAVGPDGAVAIHIELLNDEGNVVKMVSGGRPVRSLQPAEAPSVLPDDEDLVLDISTGQMGKIRRLTDPQQTIRPLRNINVAHIVPGDVPDRWQGLEAVDYIIWDEADPDALNHAQRRALAEWARQGGRLVLATARHAAALQKSEVFAEMLPVKVGPLTTLQEAGRFRRNWLDMPEEGPAYAEPIPLAQCSLLSAPGSRKVFPMPGQEGLSPELDTLIARGRVGRGALVFVAAALRDLIDPQSDPSKLFRGILEIRTTTRDDLYPETPLYRDLEGKVGFTTIGSIYLVFAILFAMGYVGLSTFGSWGFLKARGWSKHNWTVFAVVAVAASVVGIAAAQTLRGVGWKLHQLTIVEASAGAAEAYATVYFGLKTGTHSVLDVWLAENYAQKPQPHPTDCFLRPLTMGHSSGGSRLSFADPGSYELRPATAELVRVPVRATLKQFEGRWRGSLPGTVDAAVRIRKRTFERSETDSSTIVEPCFDAGSRITNRLGVDLHNCFLFQPTVNRYELEATNVSPRSGGAQQPFETLVHRIGDVSDGETFQLDSLYHDEYGNRLTWDKWHRSLLDWQNHWGKWAKQLSLSGPDDDIKAVPQERYQDVLLLLTALSEYDESQSNIMGFNQQPITFSRERCRTLDLSDILTKDMVLLVGFARGAGPVSLCARSNSRRDYKRLEPTEAWTVYRIIIPVENAG